MGMQHKFAAYHPKAITALAALVASQPLEAWKDWLVFHQINSHADVLPTRLDRDHFNFYGTTLSGTPEQRERSKRALDAVNAYLGDAVGKAYVEKYFPASARPKSNRWSATSRRRSLRGCRRSTGCPATKPEALKKVETIQVSVGYPDSWRDYSKIEIVPTTPMPTRSRPKRANMPTSSPRSAARSTRANGG